MAKINGTLRDRLGPPRPVNRFSSDSASRAHEILAS